MATIDEQITKIDKTLRETPHHKATNHFIGKMRAKIARLKDKQQEGISSKGGGGGGYAVRKRGDATAVLVGPPSAGKSTLLNKITNAQSKVAAYAFTTVSVIPGMLKYKDAYIQIFDIPGLIKGAKEGKGKGREILSVVRGADVLIVISDLKRTKLMTKMLDELYGAGIRINQERPNVSIEKKLSGGLILHSNIKQDLSKETIKEVANEFGYKNAEITLKEKLNIDSLIDSFSTSRVYIPAIFVINKSDLKKEFKKNSDYLYISAQTGEGIEEFKDKLWDNLKLVRVYLVREGEEPSFNNPIIAKEGEMLKDIAEKIGEEFAQAKKSAKIWGTQARFPGQEVSLSTKVTERMQIRFV
ncbi:GTPase [Patescibacteria group bacterium]